MPTNEIRSIILAAGKGTRMKSSNPKVLHSIMGKTLLEIYQKYLLNTFVGRKCKWRLVSNCQGEAYLSSLICKRFM